jgi:hypothetical protein
LRSWWVTVCHWVLTVTGHDDTVGRFTRVGGECILHGRIVVVVRSETGRIDAVMRVRSGAVWRRNSGSRTVAVWLVRHAGVVLGSETVKVWLVVGSRHTSNARVGRRMTVDGRDRAGRVGRLRLTHGHGVRHTVRRVSMLRIVHVGSTAVWDWTLRCGGLVRRRHVTCARCYGGWCTAA